MGGQCTPNSPKSAPQFKPKLSLAQLEQEERCPTQNNLIDEVDFFNQMPVEQIRKRFTQFYNYQEVTTSSTIKQLRQYAQPIIKHLKSDKQGAKVADQMFSHSYVFTNEGTSILCLGNKAQVFMTFLIFPDDDQWSYARWIQETLGLKSQTQRSTTTQMPLENIYFEKEINGMSYTDYMELSKWVFTDQKKVSVLRISSPHFWTKMTQMLMEEMKKTFKDAPNNDNSPEKIYQKAIKALSKDFIFLQKMTKVYRNSLTTLAFMSPYTTLAGLDDIEVSAVGGEIIYQKGGIIMVLAGTQPLELTFRLPAKDLNQTIKITPLPIPLQTLEAAFYKKGIGKELVPLQSKGIFNIGNASQPVELPEEMYIKMQFQNILKQNVFMTDSAQQALKEDGFFRQDHPLDSRLVPQKCQLRLWHNGKVVYERNHKKAGYHLFLNDFRTKVQTGDSLEIHFSEVKRINFLNQLVPLTLKRPLKFVLALKPLPSTLELLRFDVDKSPEAMLKNTFGKQEAARFEAEKTAQNYYQTPTKQVKQIIIVKNGQPFFKYPNLRTSAEFSPKEEAGPYLLKSMTLQSYESRDFDAIKQQIKRDLKTIMQANPHWKVEIGLQEKYRTINFNTVYEKVMRFESLFSAKKRDGHSIVLGTNPISLEYDDYYIEVNLDWVRGAITANIVLKRKFTF